MFRTFCASKKFRNIASSEAAKRPSRIPPQKRSRRSGTAGVDDGEVPPVPIPNTEVKLTRAEDSWLATTCENR